MIRNEIVAGVLMLTLAAQSTRADFNVTIGNATLTSGQSAIIDVMISGTPQLDQYFSEYRLTAIGGAAPLGVQFSNTQTVNVVDNSSYVFNLNSLNFDRYFGVTPATQYDLTISDLTVNALGEDVSSPLLLGRLNISSLSGLSQNSQYQIELLAGGTSFLDQSATEVAYTSTGGLITINADGPSLIATPTPLTLLTGVLSAGILSLLTRSRRKAICSTAR
jgi:hypothetical protein